MPRTLIGILSTTLLVLSTVHFLSGQVIVYQNDFNMNAAVNDPKLLVNAQPNTWDSACNSQNPPPPANCQMWPNCADPPNCSTAANCGQINQPVCCCCCQSGGYGLAYVVDIGPPFHGVVYPDNNCQHRTSCGTYSIGNPGYIWNLAGNKAYAKSAFFVHYTPGRIAKIHNDTFFTNPNTGAEGGFSCYLLGAGLSTNVSYPGVTPFMGTQSCGWTSGGDGGPGTCTRNSTCDGFLYSSTNNPCFTPDATNAIYYWLTYYFVLDTSTTPRKVRNVETHLHRCTFDSNSAVVTCGQTPLIVATLPSVDDNYVKKLPIGCSICPPNQTADCSTCYYGSDFINALLDSNSKFGDRIYPNDTYQGGRATEITVTQDYSQFVRWDTIPASPPPTPIVVDSNHIPYIQFVSGTNQPVRR